MKFFVILNRKPAERFGTAVGGDTFYAGESGLKVIQYIGESSVLKRKGIAILKENIFGATEHPVCHHVIAMLSISIQRRKLAVHCVNIGTSGWGICFFTISA